MTEHILFFYPYMSFTIAQLLLLKVSALRFDRLLIFDLFSASWDIARDAVRRIKDEVILEIVTPGEKLGSP